MKDKSVPKFLRYFYLFCSIVGYLYAILAFAYALLFLFKGLFPVSGILIIPIFFGILQGRYFFNLFKIKTILNKTVDDRERIGKSINFVKKLSYYQNIMMFVIAGVFVLIGLGTIIFAPFLQIKIMGGLVIILAIAFVFFVLWFKAKIFKNSFK